MTGVDVQVRGGRPELVITAPETAAAVAAVLDVWNRAREHKGLLPDLAVVDTARACRHMHGLAQVCPPADEQGDNGPGAVAGWLTTAQVAERLRLSHRAVTHRITAGTLPAHRVGRQWLIDPRELHRD